MGKSIMVPFVIGAGIAVVAPRMFRRAWRPPQREADRSPAYYELPEEQVWLRGATNLQLHAWFAPVDGIAPAVVVLHGWGGNSADMLDLAPALHETGIHALFLDARNHGLSEHDDHVSMLRFAEDLGFAVAYLRGRADVTDVAVIGHSVGAAASIYYASHHDDVSAVVAVVSFAHPGELMNENLPFPRPVRWAVLLAIETMIGKGFDVIAPRTRIVHVTAPVLLVHGADDDVVPIASSYELKERLPSAEMIVVLDGGHSDLKQFEPYFADVVGFLSRHLTSDPERALK